MTELEELGLVPRWPLEERLPDDGDRVLLTTSLSGLVVVGFYSSGAWQSGDAGAIIDGELSVTHWMPLPEAAESV